ncbi:MAG TPA: MATE family efflux transporter, partial [Candidatus Dormibacteraeota bacterium]
QAVAWLRIAALGAPFVCVAMAGQAWLRGYQDTVTPFVVVLVGNTVSAGLSAGLIYGAGLGIRGSAIANALAQSGSAAVFALLLRRRGARFRIQPAVLRSQLATARDLSARTLAFLVSFSVATGVAAHMGGAVVAAHQVCIQLWEFLALTLDALAIAAQALVGEQIGAGQLREARTLSWRLVRWSAWFGAGLAALLLIGLPVIPRLFVSDPAVLSQIHDVWPLLALMQPAAGAVFALDGILIGAGDTAFLARVTTMAGFLFYTPLALLAGALGLGIVGIWAGLTVFVLVRLVTCVARLRGERWWHAGRRSVAAGAEPFPVF